MTRQLNIVIDILDVEQPLNLVDARIGDGYRLGLLINRIVSLRLEAGGEPCERLVELGGLFSLPRDDQRSTRLINKNVIYLVHNGVVKLALDEHAAIP